MQEPATKKTKTVADAAAGETVELDLGDADDIEAYILHHFHAGQHGHCATCGQVFCPRDEVSSDKENAFACNCADQIGAKEATQHKDGKKELVGCLGWAANRAARFITIPKG